MCAEQDAEELLSDGQEVEAGDGFGEGAGPEERWGAEVRGTGSQGLALCCPGSAKGLDAPAFTMLPAPGAAPVCARPLGETLSSAKAGPAPCWGSALDTVLGPCSGPPTLLAVIPTALLSPGSGRH